MIFPDTPDEIKREIDPDNFIEEDSCRAHGDIPELDAESESMLPPEFQNEDFVDEND